MKPWMEEPAACQVAIAKCFLESWRSVTASSTIPKLFAGIGIAEHGLSCSVRSMGTV